MSAGRTLLPSGDREKSESDPSIARVEAAVRHSDALEWSKGVIRCRGDVSVSDTVGPGTPVRAHLDGDFALRRRVDRRAVCATRAKGNRSAGWLDDGEARSRSDAPHDAIRAFSNHVDAVRIPIRSGVSACRVVPRRSVCTASRSESRRVSRCSETSWRAHVHLVVIADFEFAVWSCHSSCCCRRGEGRGRSS